MMAKRMIGLSTLLMVTLMVTSADAQPGRGQGGGGSIFDLLRDDKVRSELEVVDDQVERMEQLQESMRDRMREMFTGMRDLPDDERRAAFEGIRDKMRAEFEKIQTQVQDVMLPHQWARLQQLQVQQFHMISTLLQPLLYLTLIQHLQQFHKMILLEN